jgi:hypothetical protein
MGCKQGCCKEGYDSKLLKVKNRHCFEEGLVTGLTSFFAVPKGQEEICIVHDGTASGLDEALWAPWFALPAFKSLEGG